MNDLTIIEWKTNADKSNRVGKTVSVDNNIVESPRNKMLLGVTIGLAFEIHLTHIFNRYSKLLKK